MLLFIVVVTSRRKREKPEDTRLLACLVVTIVVFLYVTRKRADTPHTSADPVKTEGIDVQLRNQLVVCYS